MGYVRIWIRFINNTDYLGKSVFHCHFEAHSDTGMTANMILYDPNTLDALSYDVCYQQCNEQCNEQIDNSNKNSFHDYWHTISFKLKQLFDVFF